MTSRYRIALGGVQLDSVDKNIVITDIRYNTLKSEIQRISTGNLDGFVVSGEQLTERLVTVTFMLRIYDTAKRNEACMKINEWASAGGTLTTNDRAGQRLHYTKCIQFASIESVRNWTDPLTLVFSTTSLPYWRSNNQVTKILSGKSAIGKLVLDGDVGYAPVEVTVTAKEAISSLQLKAGDTILKLTGMNIPANKTVVVDMINGMRHLRIRGNGASVMGRLDPASSDYLRAKCGDSTDISVTASGKVSAEFSARGWWR